MSMSASEKLGPERMRLNFANAVVEKFSFLTDLGFAVTESLPTIVRYRKGVVRIDVYHGRQSYELGFGVERHGVRYSLPELIRTTDAGAAAQYRNSPATSLQEISEGLSRLVEFVKRYGEAALRGDPEFFAALEEQRKTWAQEYALDVLEGQVRPKAEAAFRTGDYAEAATLYEKIRPRLSATELKKLALSRERAAV